ncbi:MFS sugar transporter-like protein [Macroventuria anomochaeta]|uniref:MFS sugar transporter-like protein n=1 Tax=Macroventuria anomochaeta TaxID=301207 RepID=A0ACB6RKN6_9PLEO|nr:MFS sugar transporter-like protein [Macroventuria anomochaeta]KAF2621970.1 MFS sugar transporter-like protein [Macroventuria anomochaeta]
MGKGNTYAWYVCMVVATTMILYGYDSSTFNAVQGSKHWVAYFHKPSPSVIGSINTAYNVGGIIAGVFMSAPISDRFGRRWAIITGCVIVIISTFISTFTPRNIGGFIAGRAIVGIGQGIALPAGPTYISEIAPAESRGKIMSFWQMNFSVGSFLAYWINYACTKNAAKLGDWDWKTVQIFQLLAPILIIIGITFCPESPRWLVKHDRLEAAVKALSKVRDNPERVQHEISDISRALQFEKDEISSGYSALWKDESIRKRLLLCILLNIGQQLTGQGSLNNYSTKIYQSVFTDNDTIQLINALNGTFGILFTLNATWTVDRFGRRFLFLVGAVGMAACMITAAAVVTETPGSLSAGKPRSVGIATVFLMFLFAFFFKPSWGATVWIWTGEIFSMNVRNQAIAISSQFQNVANVCLQQAFPVFLANEGFYAMYMFGAINVVLFAYVWFFIAETKNVSLEEMDIIFGGANHVENAELSKGTAEQIEIATAETIVMAAPKRNP